MKKIEALIKPSKLEAVKEGLVGIGINEMSIIEAKEFGPKKGRTSIFRGTEFTLDYLPKVKIEIVVNDTLAPPVIALILEAAKTGEAREGKVLVSTLDQILSLSAEGEIEDVLQVSS